MVKRIALDFGTSNTVPCTSDQIAGARNFRVIEDEGNYLIASMVAYQLETPKYFGATVRANIEQMAAEGYTIRRSVKTHLRRAARQGLPLPAEHMAAMAEIIGYAARRSAAADPQVAGQAQVPVVLTIPYDAPPQYRAKLIDICRQQRNPVLSPEFFVSEPTAALFSFVTEIKKQLREACGAPRHFMVFDWGGGTLDISIVRAAQGRFREIGSAGEDLAGDNIDRLLAELALARCGNGGAHSPEFLDLLNGNVEELKKHLSRQTEDYFNQPGLTSEFRLRREEFEELIEQPILTPAMNIMDRALVRSGLADHQIDRVFLVGGSSHIPAIRRRLGERFPGRVSFHQDQTSQEAVARGAAHIAALGCEPFLAWQIGVWLCNGEFLQLLPHDLPWSEFVEKKRSLTFYVTDCRAKEIEIPLGYEFESLESGSMTCELLKTMRLSVGTTNSTIPRVVALSLEGRTDGTLALQSCSYNGRYKTEIILDRLPWGLQIPSAMLE